MKNQDNMNLTKNIKSLVFFFTLCFFSIIVYLTYFNLYVGDKILDDPSNKRIRAEENKVLRGSILDKNGNVIAHSERTSNGSQKRIYDQGELFSHIVGYNSYVYGKSGIENTFNDNLQGKSSGHDIFGSIFRSLKESIKKDDKKGNDVVLTLDDSLQKTSLSALGDDKGAIVTMNPKTGEILSMVSAPIFDPQNIDKKFKTYNKDEKDTPLINRASQGYYPPGSVFKIVTAAAAYEHIPNIANSSIDCDGRLTIGNYTLKDYHGTAHGAISMAEAIKKSCNYFFGTLGMKLGFDNLISTAEKFMFNKSVSEDMLRYSIPIKTGSIKVDDPKSKSYMAQDAIGQHNVAANPMQMVMVASAVANKGKVMTPYVVKEVKDRYGKVVDKPTPKVLSEAMPENVASKLSNYMVGVVDDGTGTNAKIRGIEIAGKTGSAEDASKNATHAWFIGFAPANDPQIAIAIVVENGGVGGKRAASAAKKVLETYFNK
ncbi:peptidoglycan D,D-transpeptidase FtsI family protein [Clostridium cylindrosporum]|uniref:Penicillin-binding protein A n=1 Tax=Clostridium cylindrosporum DSM 605 TaxID=1121307 RepID=A0A0J8D9U4_CLOCY|nr:penicillin-binding transpeptidase domain-containing protein [Clostridium cylindrosporum]KMT21079.1 penicillin-binding protein A [Clostridium cylindrosporum DSM 605]